MKSFLSGEHFSQRIEKKIFKTFENFALIYKGLWCEKIPTSLSYPYPFSLFTLDSSRGRQIGQGRQIADGTDANGQRTGIKGMKFTTNSHSVFDTESGKELKKKL